MTALLLTPSVLSLLLLAAHFLRSGETGLVVVCAATSALALIPRRWASSILQGTLALGAAEWLWTTVLLAQARAGMGLPAGRMIAILGAVALMSLLAAGLHWTPRLRRHFS